MPEHEPHPRGVGRRAAAEQRIAQLPSRGNDVLAPAPARDVLVVEAAQEQDGDAGDVGEPGAQVLLGEPEGEKVVVRAVLREADEAARSYRTAVQPEGADDCLWHPVRDVLLRHGNGFDEREARRARRASGKCRTSVGCTPALRKRSGVRVRGALAGRVLCDAKAVRVADGRVKDDRLNCRDDGKQPGVDHARRARNGRVGDARCVLTGELEQLQDVLAPRAVPHEDETAHAIRAAEVRKERQHILDIVGQALDAEPGVRARKEGLRGGNERTDASRVMAPVRTAFRRRGVPRRGRRGTGRQGTRRRVRG